MNKLDTFDALLLITSTLANYRASCSKTGDCATVADVIRRHLEEQPSMQITSLSIADVPKRIREGDIVILRVPTLFAHFHYVTMVYELKKAFLFQHYGSYTIPMLWIDVDSFCTMIQDYLRILAQTVPTDTELTELLTYEQTLYGLSRIQLQHMMDLQIMPLLDQIEERCMQYQPVERNLRERIKTELASLTQWNDHALLTSYCTSEPHVTIKEWLEAYTETIMTQLIIYSRLLRVVDEDDLRRYIQEKLAIRMGDLYLVESEQLTLQPLSLRIIRMLFYKNGVDQRDTTEVIRYHVRSRKDHSVGRWFPYSVHSSRNHKYHYTRKNNKKSKGKK